MLLRDALIRSVFRSAARRRERLSYHWVDPFTRQVVVFEGDRSELSHACRQMTACRYSMRVEAPAVSGKYVLQTTMLQESVGWFEDFRPDILQAFEVVVQPQTPHVAS